MTFGIQPGKMVGTIKNAIRDAILDGIIPNEHDAARKLMMEKGIEMGLNPVDNTIGL
jgi:poly(A) polymerase